MQGRAGSEMWGVLLVPSSSPTSSPMYDGLDVNVTSNATWFHLNHNMVSRRIYKLSFYGGHSITQGYQLRLETAPVLLGRYLITGVELYEARGDTKGGVRPWGG